MIPSIQQQLHPEDSPPTKPTIIDRRTGDIVVTQKDLRNWTIAAIVGFLIMFLGASWSINKVQDKARNDLVENAVALCERGAPVRIQTNTSAYALKVVAEGQARFLRAIAEEVLVPEPQLRTRAISLAETLDTLAATQRTVAVADCDQVRAQLNMQR